MNKFFSFIFLQIALGGVVPMLTGCSSELPLELVPLNTLPPSIVDKETVWELQPEIAYSQQEMLLDYLKENPSFTEAPRMKGEPALYTALDDHLRFYWLAQPNHEDESYSEVEWLYLEFDGESFVSFEEGSGFLEEFTEQ